MSPTLPLSILLAERDDTLRALLVDQLAAGGHQVSAAPDLETAVTILRRRTAVDVIVLDATLAADDTVIDALDDSGIPVLLLLPAPGGAPATETLLERGGDALLGKPFRLAVLLEHLRAVSARSRHVARADTGTLTIGPHVLDLRTRILRQGDGDSVRLTGKEVEILTHLRQADGPISREALLDAVWGYGQGIDTHTLETHIYRLRRKIEVDPAHAVLLVTEPGGYRLTPCD